jgi:hypothetical protein
MKKSEAIDRIGQIDAAVARLLAERQRLIDVKKFDDVDGTLFGDEFKLTGYSGTCRWLNPKKVRRAVGAAAMAKMYSSKATHGIRVTERSE